MAIDPQLSFSLLSAITHSPHISPVNIFGCVLCIFFWTLELSILILFIVNVTLRKNMSIFKVSVKYLYLSVVNPQGEASGCFSYYLNDKPNSISCSLSLYHLSPSSNSSFQQLACVMRWDSFHCVLGFVCCCCCFCVGIVSFMELKNFLYFCPPLWSPSFPSGSSLDCFILPLRSLKLCLYFLVFELSIFHFFYL